MVQKIRLVIPEAPSPQAVAVTETRAVAKGGIRLGILDNSKGNADHLLRFIVEGVKALLPVASVIALRKDSVSLPAPAAIHTLADVSALRWPARMMPQAALLWMITSTGMKAARYSGSTAPCSVG